jgi:hypothetical protein
MIRALFVLNRNSLSYLHTLELNLLLLNDLWADPVA